MYSTLNLLCNPSFRPARLARQKDDGLSTAAVPSLPLGPRRGECLEIQCYVKQHVQRELSPIPPHAIAVSS
jgi:hypothetical protein